MGRSLDEFTLDSTSSQQTHSKNDSGINEQTIDSSSSSSGALLSLPAPEDVVSKQTIFVLYET
jgi:hypothetical protein